MKRGERRQKQHVISLRISAEEMKSLHEIMQGSQFKRVSDLMRAGFNLVQARSATYATAAAEGPKRSV